MMTEEQRYLFDLCGYLHLSNALTCGPLMHSKRQGLLIGRLFILAFLR